MEADAKTLISFRQTNRLSCSRRVHHQGGGSDVPSLVRLDDPLGNRTGETEVVGVHDESATHDDMPTTDGRKSSDGSRFDEDCLERGDEISGT